MNMHELLFRRNLLLRNVKNRRKQTNIFKCPSIFGGNILYIILYYILEKLNIPLRFCHCGIIIMTIKHFSFINPPPQKKSHDHYANVIITLIIKYFK